MLPLAKNRTVTWTGVRKNHNKKNIADLLKGRAVQQVGNGEQQGGVYGAKVVLQSIALVDFISL